MSFRKEDLATTTVAEKLFLASAIIAIVSLFLPWVDIGFVKVNGFQQQGYIFLVGFIYPIFTILMKKTRKELATLIVAAITLLGSIAFYFSKSESLYGVTVNLASTGLSLMVLANVINTVAAFLEFKGSKR